MELELGLKITKTRDDISSISEYQLAKDKGPIFQSRETNTTFILTALLKGYKRNNIDIKISKDGNKITISGEKPIQEMVMIGWVMHKKVVDVTGFNKAFKIPNGVNLDRIKAKYDEDEWILSIVMPKLVKGICGIRIDEVKEEEFDKRKSELENNETDHVSSSVGETSQRGSKEPEVQDMDDSGNIMEKMVDDTNKDITGGTVEKEEPKLRNEDDKLKGRIVEEEEQNVGASQGVSEECLAQQSGESKQKFGESKYETDDRFKENMKESSKMESEVDDQNLVDHIPSNIGDTRLRQKELEESRMQQKEKTKSTKGKIDGGKREKTPNAPNKDVEKTILGDIIQKDNIKPKTEIDNEDHECVREKPGKEGSDAVVGIREQFPKTTFEESEELNVQKMQEIKDVKEEMIKRKGKEIEYFEEKGEVERQKTMHVDANKDTREVIEEENEKRKNGIEESGQHAGENTVKGRFEPPKTITEDLPKKLVELDGSKGFKVKNLEEQEEMIKEEKADTECLMEKDEGEEYKRNEEADKVLDGTNKKMNEERIKKEVGESNMGIGDGNGKGMRKNIGKEVYEVLKSSEKEKNVGVCIPQRIEDTTSQDKDTEVQKMESRSVEKKEGRVSEKMLDDGNGDQTGREKSKLRIEDGKIDKAAHDAMKTSEREKDVGAGFPQNIEDISQDKESEDEKIKEKGSVVEKEKMESDNMFHDTNEDITEEIEKSMFGIEEGGGKSAKENIGKEEFEAMKSSELEKNVSGCTTQTTGVTSQEVSEDPLIQQSGKSKQKEFGDSKYETEERIKENMKNNNMEAFEEMKVSEHDDQNVVDYIPSNIGDISQKELEESRIQQVEKSKRTGGKIDGGKYGKTPVEGNKDFEKTIFGGIIQKDFIKPNIESENEGQECIRENPGKEVSDAMAAIKEDIPKHLPKTTLEEREELNVQKMQEIKDVKEEIIKRKGKEKGEVERQKTMHVDANRGITRDTIEEETEKRKNEIEESGQHVGENTVKERYELPKGITEELPKQLVELDGSNEFKVEKEEKQEEMIKEEKDDAESLMENEEGEQSKKTNEEADKVLDANKEMNEEKITKEVGESNMGISDGNGKGVRKKVGKEGHEVMKTSELEKNVGVCIPQGNENTTSQDKDTEVHKMERSVEKKKEKVSDEMLSDGTGDQTGSTIKKGSEESKLRIEDGKVTGMREKIGKATQDAIKASVIEQDVGAGFPPNIGVIRQDQQYEDQEVEEKGSVVEKEKMESDNMLDETNEDIAEEIQKSKFGIEEGEGKRENENVGKEGCEAMNSSELEKNVGASSTQIGGATSQGISEEYLTQQSGESKQKQFGESKCEPEDSRLKETMKRKNDDEQYEKEPIEANKDVENTVIGDIIQRDITKPKIETENEDQECDREKPGNERSDAKVASIREEFQKHFPKPTLEESENLKVQKLKEIEDDKEEIIKRKGKEIEYFVEKGEGERYKTKHGEKNKGITRERMQEKVEKKNNGVDESGNQHIGENIVKGVFEVPKSITEELSTQSKELDGSKEVKVAKEEGQKEVTKEAIAEAEILMEKVEGEESKMRNEDASSVTGKSTVIETLLKKTEESNIEKKSSDEPLVQEKFPKQVVEAISQDEKDKNEHGIVTLEGKGSIEMHVEPNEAFENDTTENRIEKEIRKQKLESGDQLNLKENVDNGIFDGRKRQNFPGMEEAEDAKENGAKNEGYVKKVTGDKYEKIHVETNEDLNKDITKETRGEKTRDPKGEPHLHEVMSKERSQQSKAAKELNIREKFPKHLPKTTLEESEVLSVQKMQEIKDVREEMIKRKGKDTEHFVEKGEGERHKTMHVDANKGLTTETIEDDMEKRKNGVDENGQQHIEKDIVKGRFELPKSITEEHPKNLVKLDGSKGFKIAEEEGQQEMIKAEKDKTECFMEKEEGEESKNITEIADKVLDDANKEIKEERIKKEVGESKKGIGDGNGKCVRKRVGKEEDEVMMKTLELEKIVGVCIPQRIKDTTSKDKKSEVQEMDSRSVEKKEGREEFPTHLPKATLEESGELNVQKMQEIKDVKEERIKRKGKENEYSEEKADGEKHETRHVEENKGTTRETMQENIEKKKNGVDESGQNVGENIVKGVFEVPKSITEEMPKQLEELDGSKEVKVAKEAEQKEVTKEAMDETEILMDKKEGEESKRNEEASSGTEKSRVIETLLKKPEESNIEKKSSDGPLIKEKLPKKVGEAIAEPEKDKTEHGIVKLKGKGSIKMHVEPNEALENDTAGNRIEKNARKQKHESSDQSTVKEIVNNEIFDGIKRQNFPEMEEDENAKEDGAKIERSVKKVNGDKYETIQVEVNEHFKKEIIKETKGKEIEDPKIQTKEKGEHHLHEEMSKEISQESKSARNDPFKDTVHKEKEEPKILNKVKDQQCLQEDMSKGRYEASTTAREFPMQIVDSLAKTIERPKNKETEEAEEAKGDLAKRKSGETKVVESRTKEKFQGTESEKTTQILHEAPEEKHPKAFEIGTPERELQSERGHTTSANVVNMGLKEAEQGRTKDKKQKTRLLPPKTSSKETHGSEDEGENQHDFKPKQTKEVGEQRNYNTEGTKEVAAKEDQEIKPSSSHWFPSTQQSEVKEKDKLYEGGKAKYEASRESQKKDLTKDMQNFIEMKENQEGKQKEALKPEIPLDKHPKKGELVIRRGEFHKGKNEGEKMQEKTDGPKKTIDVRNQQYEAIHVGKVESTEEEKSKEYKADAGSIAERMETKKGLKTTHEREDDMPTQNVDDEKPKIQDEIIKADIEKVDKDKCNLESMKTTQEKEHPIKSEAVEKETESLEATSSLPNVTSMGVKEESPKKEIEDLHQKELSALEEEMKSKEPPEVENPVVQWKFPKTKEHVPLTELRDKEQHSYFTGEIEEQKIAAYEGAKPSKFQRQIVTQQSTDEENRKSENDVEEHKASKESPKVNIGKTEQIDSFQPQILGNEYYEEHKFDEQDEALDQCEFQGQKILKEDRGQQHVQDNNDNKGSQTPKDVEEEMFMKEREGSKVAKSGEAKDSSRNKRERGKTTHIPEAKKPKMKEKTSHFEKASGSKKVADKMHETGDREHQIDSEEVTSKSKVRVEPPTMIEKTPNKEVERKEPQEITWPNMDYETPQISEVQEEKEGERHVHALEANISKEALEQATATHSNTKSEDEPKGENKIDKPQVNQLPSPFIEMLSKEPQESEECSMKECDSEGETIVQVSEKKEPIHSTEGTTAPEEVSVKEESQEAEKDSKTDVQEPNKGKRDQQCINKGEEEKYGINEIEEKGSGEGLEEQKEYKEEANGGKKDDTTMPKKLFVPLVLAGSALLGGIFVWHRRTRKR